MKFLRNPNLNIYKMAENQHQSSIDFTFDTSTQSELEKSESLLPQEEPRNDSQTASTPYESSFELSGFSCVVSSVEDYNSEVNDPFNNVFYRTIPSQKSTHIHFYARPLFNMVLSMLEKEFSTPGEDVNKFLLKTHIKGKKCHINVDRNDCTILATGPGHVNWKENNFKRMAKHMFKNFVDKTNSENVAETISMDNTPSANPIMKNISALMDMIHSLQGEVDKLTKEVNKLVQQATTSFAQSNDTTTLSRPGDNSKCENAQNESGTGNEIAIINSFVHVQDPNQRGNFTSDDIRLTSTPGPMPVRLQESCVVQSSPRSSTSHPRSHPVPKPSVPAQTAKKSLLIGDSIICGINKEGLKEHVYQHGISGAKVKTILNEIKMYDLQQFSNVVIYVGGNNASNKTDIETFEDLYGQLLEHIKEKSECRIILVNSCPRGDTDTSTVNSVIRRLSEYHNTELVDSYKAFYDKSAKLIERFYSSDYIHLSDSGTRRLLGSINEKLEIVEDFTKITYRRPAFRRGHKRSPARSATQHVRRSNLIYPNQNNGQNSSASSAARHVRSNLVHPNQENGQISCAKCGESNHETRNCRHAEQIKCYECGYYGHKSRRCGNQ